MLSGTEGGILDPGPAAAQEAALMLRRGPDTEQLTTARQLTTAWGSSTRRRISAAVAASPSRAASSMRESAFPMTARSGVAMPMRGGGSRHSAWEAQCSAWQPAMTDLKARAALWEARAGNMGFIYCLMGNIHSRGALGPQ